MSSANSKRLPPSSVYCVQAPGLLVDKGLITKSLSLLLGWSRGSIDQMVPRTHLNALEED